MDSDGIQEGREINKKKMVMLRRQTALGCGRERCPPASQAHCACHLPGLRPQDALEGQPGSRAHSLWETNTQSPPPFPSCGVGVHTSSVGSSREAVGPFSPGKVSQGPRPTRGAPPPEGGRTLGGSHCEGRPGVGTTAISNLPEERSLDCLKSRLIVRGGTQLRAVRESSWQGVETGGLG